MAIPLANTSHLLSHPNPTHQRPLFREQKVMEASVEAPINASINAPLQTELVPRTPRNFSRKLSPPATISERRLNKDLPAINTQINNQYPETRLQSPGWTPPPTLEPNFVDTHSIPGMTAMVDAFVQLRSDFVTINATKCNFRDDNMKLQRALEAKENETEIARERYYDLLGKFNRLTRSANQVLDLAHELKNEVEAAYERHGEPLPAKFQEKYRLCTNFDDALEVDDEGYVADEVRMDLLSEVHGRQSDIL